MAALQVVRDSILMSYENDIIDDKECVFLYDINWSINLDYLGIMNVSILIISPIWSAECWTEFRFLKNDVFVLKDVLRIRHSTAVDGIEAPCIFLKRFITPPDTLT